MNDRCRNSQVTRQIECDAAAHMVAVLEVAKEPDGRVESGYDDHPRVQHAGPSAEVLWRLHVILQREHLKWYH